MPQCLNIAVADTAYEGLFNAALLAQHSNVIALDIVQAKVELINALRSQIENAKIECYPTVKPLNLMVTMPKLISLSSPHSPITTTTLTMGRSVF